MTRSVSLTFASRRSGMAANSDLEVYEGETAALKDFCLPVRSYGTCGNLTPYVPSPTSQHNRYRKCITYVVNANETLAGIALRHNISVEDIRRTNSFLWTSNSVWVGQAIKIPIIDYNTITEENIDVNVSPLSGEDQKVSSTKRKPSSTTGVKIGPSASEFWTKVDSSIEESRKANTNQMKKNCHTPQPPKDDLKC
jgi:hypothetical protein